MTGEIGNVAKTRLFFPDGRIEEYDNVILAYAIYIGLDKGVKVAWRSAMDTTPVYSHDYVDVDY